LPAAWAALLYFPGLASLPPTGAAALAAVETWRTGVFATGGHPLLPLLGRLFLSLHVADSPYLAAGLGSALLAVGAAPLIALACLESVRAARSESGWHDHSPDALDWACAVISACALVASPLAIRHAAQGAWTMAGLGAAAALVAATQRWRRMGRLDAAGAAALGIAWAVGQTGEPGFIVVPLAGLLPVWFTALSRPRRVGDEPRHNVAAPLLCFVAAVLIGLVPWITVPILSPSGSAPVPLSASPGGIAGYFLAYLVGPSAFNVGVDAGTVAARDGVVRLGHNIGPCMIVGVVLAAVWVSVFRSPSGDDPKGRALSAGLWPGALLTVACWTLGWSYTGPGRDARLSLCLLGLCMCAAAGLAVTLEVLHRRFRRGVVPLLAGLALGVPAWSIPRVSAQWTESRSGAAYSYVVAAVADAPAGCVFEVGDELEPFEDLVYPLIYGREVLGLRPDVAVVIADQMPSPPSPLPREGGAVGRGEGDRRPIRFTDWRAARDAGWPVRAEGHFLAFDPGPRVEVGSQTVSTPAAAAAAALSAGAAAAEEVLRSSGRRPEAREVGIVAEAWAAEGEWSRAHAAAREAIRLDPLRPQPWRVLGEALLHSGGRGAAEACLRVAVAVSRRHPDARAVRLLAEARSEPRRVESGPDR